MKAALPGHVLLGLGALTAVISGTQGWWVARAETTVVHQSQDTAGTAGMLTLVVVIGWLLWLTRGRIARRVVGVVIALVAGAMVAYGWHPPRPSISVAGGAATPGGSAAGEALGLGPWHWAYAAAGCLILVGAVLLAVGAPDRQRKFDRYRRGHHDAASVTADDDVTQVWRALDAGYDPTAAEEPAKPDPPVRRSRQSRDAPDDQNPPSGGNLAKDRGE